MFEKYYPSFIKDRVVDIDIVFLNNNSIKGLILDIDNTLVASHVKEADEKLINWMDSLREKGIKLAIVSNASSTRVLRFNERLKLHAVHRAYKPGTKGFLKAALLMKLEPEDIAVVGDQIFTDIRGGNKAKMKTILVKPIDKKEILFVQLKRYPEKYILNRYNTKLNKL